jgi:hypothetical protein
MRKWQYVVQEIAREDGDSFVPHPLNVMGNNGWELVAVIPEGDNYRLFLKRPVYPRLDPEVEKLVREHQP